jgi:hypothetical protein
MCTQVRNVVYPLCIFIFNHCSCFAAALFFIPCSHVPIEMLSLLLFLLLLLLLLLLLCFIQWRNGFDLIDVTMSPHSPIATSTIVDGNGLFCQGGDQLNGGRSGKGDV